MTELKNIEDFFEYSQLYLYPVTDAAIFQMTDVTIKEDMNDVVKKGDKFLWVELDYESFRFRLGKEVSLSDSDIIVEFTLLIK